MSTPKEPKYRKRVGYQAVLLGGFSTLATALLVAGNIATKDDIKARQKEDLLYSLNQVVPTEYYDSDLLEQPLSITDNSGDNLTVYRGLQGMQVNALAWEVIGKGYAGDIRLIMGINAKGEVLGVRVLSHAETPGLGDKIEVAKDDWILGFNEHSLDNTSNQQWRVKKDGGKFDQFSGATITPRAIVTAVHEGLIFFQQHTDELLQPPVINLDDEPLQRASITE
ncbi:MAG: electron transport complex subunit RsxG [Candidatus Thiodiazotropha lotti]|uniref:Ion-translocating oxidoreductase complex subunit G n=1 Tax=Candidatus Thiodiazotropha endoloripes TaxID=1818881 RepID=A0A1E2USY9_9GAMM|nr:electron transport complex subunit RsxG [Candidatus Thiodiazotropha endoloripes]MCG7899469.1 electron transport complex subunit RsxG [Candidatus Thiodiazotropha weberae]MCG7990724.1 electron transport complex subunit RsxG [Candidatus Thiodiazotropha lotti]MCG7999411.1 electron transport complex subunit RsxG [Candidatus Thiodiazotropha lotti]MCW4182378.1 electron transport complex subunit RsxG [Candidatus Thiodiazotropha weberae]MCW4191179.1 electron transport complex subunit RsxG [Candidatu